MLFTVAFIHPPSQENKRTPGESVSHLVYRQKTTGFPYLRPSLPAFSTLAFSASPSIYVLKILKPESFILRKFD